MNVGEIKAKITADASGFKKATAESETALQKLQKTTENFAKNVAGAFSFGAIVKFGHEALKAQGEAEQSINRLNLALANHGKFSEQASHKLRELAGQIQDTTTFSDTAVVAVEAMFASYGMGAEEIVRATQATVDFAAATGKDLSEAATVVARAFNGQTAGLEKLGIVVNDNMTKTQKYEAALKQLEGRFAGSGAAATQTYLGGLKQLENAWGSAQEALGKFLGTLTGGEKPFSVLISAGQSVAKFFSVTLVLALNEAQVKMVEFLATLADTSARFNNWMASRPSWMLGIGASGIKSDARKAAAEAEEMARALRAQIPALREQGNAAALSAGNLLKVTNATKQNIPVTDEATKAAKKYADALEEIHVTTAKLAQDLNEGFFAELQRVNQQGNLDPTKGPTGSYGQQLLALYEGGLNDEHMRGRSIGGTMLGFTQGGVAAGSSFLVGFKQTMASLPAVILGALQGGGNVGASIGAAMGAQIGNDIAQAMSKKLVGALGKTLGGAIGSAIPIVGTLLGGAIGSLIGGLFGRGKRQAEELKKKQDQAMSSLEGLIAKWKQFRDEIIAKGLKGLADVFAHFATQTNLSAEQLKNLGVIGIGVFNAMRKAGMSIVDAMKAMAEALSKAGGIGGKADPKLVQYYEDLTRRIDELLKIEKQRVLTTEEQNELDRLKFERWRAGKQIEMTPATFGPEFDSFVKFQAFVEANESLVRAVEGLAVAFDTVRLGAKLTQEQFDAWLATGLDLFNQLLAKGATYDQALIISAGYLYRIKKAHEDWGLVVDEHTQKLIDDAEAMGLFEDMEDPLKTLVDLQGQMLGILALIAQAFGVHLPAAIQKYIDKLNEIPAPKVPDGGTPTPPPPDDDGPKVPFGFIPAADGFFGDVNRPTLFLAGEAGPETVSITPQGGGGSNADILAALRRLERVLPKMTRDAVLMGRASK